MIILTNLSSYNNYICIMTAYVEQESYKFLLLDEF